MINQEIKRGEYNPYYPLTEFKKHIQSKITMYNNIKNH